MDLGTLIETFEAIDPELLVEFSDGRWPYEFASWRGDYYELTLVPGYRWNGTSYDNEPQSTVGQLLEKAHAANGGTFEGYKGGEYTMHLSTPIWADEYGEYRCNAITGLTVEGNVVILHLINILDYR